LKEFASAHGGKIEVRGWVDEGEKWRVLARSRVVILPSYEEGWGISIQEALQAGAQVVAYDLPAVRRLHGNTIELVPRGDWQAMVERVRQLLTQAVSPGQQRHPPTEAASWKAIAEQELVDIEARLAAQQSRCRP
jgi:glycosyltransferase involved in cell wall biosynthesis